MGGVGRRDCHRDFTGGVVTAWGPHVVARFARAAGFNGEALHDAVALAMAASGGADHYSHNPIAHPGAERRGLWAIRVDQVPTELAADLFDGADNARVARRLWEDSGGAFSWHPTWINGAAAREREWTVRALTQRNALGGIRELRPFSDALGHMIAVANAYGLKLQTGQVHDA